MKNTLLIGVGQILTAVAIGALVAVVFISLPRVDRYLNLMATQDCATSYRLAFTDKATTTTISRPIDDLYRKCLTEKGL